MRQQLKRLADYARANKIRLYLAIVPDVHNLIDYKLGFIHEIMRQIATQDGYVFVDLLPALKGRPPEQLWAMPGDPHPNGLGHKLMAEAMFPMLAEDNGATQETRDFR
jgi:lysophospholipase L1-like esterase